MFKTHAEYRAFLLRTTALVLVFAHVPVVAPPRIGIVPGNPFA